MHSSHSVVQQTVVVQVGEYHIAILDDTMVIHTRSIVVPSLRPRHSSLLRMLCSFFILLPGNKCDQIEIYAVVTCDIKLFQNYFSLRRCMSEIILFPCEETCPKSFQNYFTGYCSLWIFFNMFSVTEIILKWFQISFSGWNNFIWVSDMVTREI